MTTNLKLRTLPRAILKGKISTKFPGTVTGVSPIVVSESGGNFVIGIDIDALNSLLTDVMAGVIVVFDGSGAVLTVGKEVDIPVPFACTIHKASMYADQNGSLVIDVYKDTHGNFPPTAGDSICAS